jgi:hypothetical protein
LKRIAIGTFPLINSYGAALVPRKLGYQRLHLGTGGALAVLVKAAAEELERLGIADRAGKHIRKDLPKDMREGTDRDFGG